MAEDTRRTRRERITGDIDEICASPEAARRVVSELTKLAGVHVTPGRSWSAEDLRDVIEAALRVAPSEAAQVLPGRDLRRRLHHQCIRASRYGERFACVVLHASKSVDRATHPSIVDAIVERVRSTDIVFVYRRRFAILMPRIGRADAVEPIVARVRALIAVGAGARAIASSRSIVFPSSGVTAASVLDWAEDQLRD